VPRSRSPRDDLLDGVHAVDENETQGPARVTVTQGVPDGGFHPVDRRQRTPPRVVADIA
jgi:hypothetical protein